MPTAKPDYSFRRMLRANRLLAELGHTDNNTALAELKALRQERDKLREALNEWKEWWECKSVGNSQRGPIYLKTIEALANTSSQRTRPAMPDHQPTEAITQEQRAGSL